MELEVLPEVWGTDGGGRMNGESKCTILVDKEKAVKWIKENKDTDVGNTPLWVLIGLGLRALKEEENGGTDN